MDKRINQEVKTGELSKLFLRGALEPKSFDEKSNSLDVIFTTGARGLRSTFFGDYYEELSVEPGSVRLDRLNTGAPVLAAHDSRSLDSVIGVVENAKIEDKKGVARVRLSQTENDADIVQKIRDGIIRKVSVGYQVYAYEELPVKENNLPVFRAIDWEPVEISFVPVPFDNEAQVRANEEKVTCKLILRTQGDQMEANQVESPAPVEQPAAPVAPAAPEAPEAPAVPAAPVVGEGQAPKVDVEAVRAAESERVSAIFKAVRTAGLDDSLAEELVKGNKPLTECQSIVLERWAQKGKTPMIDGKIQVTGEDQQDVMVRGITNALQHRAGQKVELTTEGRQFRGLSLIRIAEKMLKSRGINADSMSASEIARLALSRETWRRDGYQGVSDFPGILADVANKSLRQAYEQSPQTFKPFVRVTSAPDFKNVSRVQLGEAPSLSQVNEHGEFTHGSVGDSKETYALATYGRIISLSRKALINDDVSAFERLPVLMGRSAANLESDLVYQVLTANAAMADSVALFHSSHANLGTTGAISATTLAEMRKLGRLQTGIDGATLLNIFHKYLIVPAAKETLAQQMLAAVVPNQTSGVNPFANLYQLIVEPRLDANSTTAWYGAADPAQIDTIELCFLEGSQGVRIESEIDFDTDGMKMKVAHDVAAKAIDWRGLFKNVGA